MAGYDPIVFQNPEGLTEPFVVATYYLETAAADLVKKAADIAVGQTTGGWTELPRATRSVMEKAVGRVLSVIEVPPSEEKTAPLGGPASVGVPPPVGLPVGGAAAPHTPLRRAVVRIAYPAENMAADLGALLVAVYGKVSLDGTIKLVDLELPASFVSRMPGPQHGIAGIRKLVKADSRPLAMSIFKPTLGLPVEDLAAMLREQALGGMDLVKDDEVLADETLDTALRRAELCRKAAEAAEKETGRRIVHAINLTGPAEELIPRARKLSAAGASCLLFNVLAYGIPTLAALARDREVTAALMAHPALAGGMALEAGHGIAAHLLLGKLLRLAGADLVLFPSPYGSVGLRRESALKLSFTLTRPLHGLKTAFPVPSAGITPSLVPQLLADYGADVVVNAGGAVHGHPDGARAGAEAFVAAIAAAHAGTPLAEAASSSKPLARALEVWK